MESAIDPDDVDVENDMTTDARRIRQRGHVAEHVGGLRAQNRGPFSESGSFGAFVEHAKSRIENWFAILSFHNPVAGAGHTIRVGLCFLRARISASAGFLSVGDGFGSPRRRRRFS